MNGGPLSPVPPLPRTPHVSTSTFSGPLCVQTCVLKWIQRFATLRKPSKSNLILEYRIITQKATRDESFPTSYKQLHFIPLCNTNFIWMCTYRRKRQRSLAHCLDDVRPKASELEVQWGRQMGRDGMSGWMQDIGDVQEQDNTQFSSHYVLPFSFQRAFAVCCCYGIHTVTQPHSHTYTHTPAHSHTHTLSYYLLLLRT